MILFCGDIVVIHIGFIKNVTSPNLKYAQGIDLSISTSENSHVLDLVESYEVIAVETQDSCFHIGYFYSTLFCVQNLVPIRELSHTPSKNKGGSRNNALGNKVQLS